MNTYDGRMSAAQVEKARTGKRPSIASSSRTIPVLVVRRPLSTCGEYALILTAVVDDNGRLISVVEVDRAGRVHHQHAPGGFYFQVCAPGVGATREAGDAVSAVSKEILRCYGSAFEEHQARAAEDCARQGELDQARRRAEAFAAGGARLVMSGYKGALYELPDGRIVVRMHGAGEESICCQSAALHRIDNRIRGQVGCDAHAKDCTGDPMRWRPQLT